MTQDEKAKQRSESARKAALAGAAKRKVARDSIMEEAEEYKILSGIPLPASGSGNKIMYDFLYNMKVDDCILIKDKKEFNKIRQAAYQAGKKIGKKFQSRKTPKGYGIWRTK